MFHSCRGWRQAKIDEKIHTQCIYKLSPTPVNIDSEIRLVKVNFDRMGGGGGGWGMKMDNRERIPDT